MLTVHYFPMVLLCGCAVVLVCCSTLAFQRFLTDDQDLYLGGWTPVKRPLATDNLLEDTDGWLLCPPCVLKGDDATDPSVTSRYGSLLPSGSADARSSGNSSHRILKANDPSRQGAQRCRCYCDQLVYSHAGVLSIEGPVFNWTLLPQRPRDHR